MPQPPESLDALGILLSPCVRSQAGLLWDRDPWGAKPREVNQVISYQLAGDAQGPPGEKQDPSESTQ